MADTDLRRAGADFLLAAWPSARGWPASVHYALLALMAAVSYWQVFFGRGLDVPDEGLLLHVAERLADGQVPYRDVYFVYTPGVQYLLAGLFRVLGPSLGVEHALLFAVHLALVLVVYALASRVAWRPLAVAAALVVMASGVSPYRTLMGLVAIVVLTTYAESGRRAWLLMSGLLIGASYLVGQEIGLYTLGAALGFLAVDGLSRAGTIRRLRDHLPGHRQAASHRSAGDEPLPYVTSRNSVAAAALHDPPSCRDPRWSSGLGGTASLWHALGSAALVVAAAAVVVLPWVTVMAAQGAFPAMLEDTVRVTFLHQPRYMHVPLPPLLPLAPDDLAANVVWGPPAYLVYVKLLLYLPLMTVAASAGVLSARLLHDEEAGATRRVLPLALFAALALGTLAFRADYYHLRQVLPITLVLLAWLLSELRAAALTHGSPRWLAGGVLLPLAAILIVTAGEAAAQQATLSVPLETARGTVLVDAATAHDLGGLLHDLAARTTPGEAIYIAPAETAVYFLADRRNPTRFGQLVPTETEILREEGGTRQRELIAAVDATGVRWVVTANLDNVDGVPFAGYAPLIASYLDAEFQPVARYGYWTLRGRITP